MQHLKSIEDLINLKENDENEIKVLTNHFVLHIIGKEIGLKEFDEIVCWMENQLGAIIGIEDGCMLNQYQLILTIKKRI